MSANVPAVRQQHSPLTALAIASASSSLPARPAQTPLEAIVQAHAVFAAAYGNLWIPAENAQLAWNVVLGDTTPDEIAAASIAWMRDVTPDERGRPRGGFPPNPSQIRVRIIEVRRSSERERVAREREQERAVEIAQRVAGLKATGRWESLSAAERENLATWEAYGSRVIAARAAAEARATADAATPKPAADVANARGDARKPAKGPACASFSAGAVVVLVGLLLGARAARFEPVREARTAAFEALASLRFAWPGGYAANISTLEARGENQSG